MKFKRFFAKLFIIVSAFFIILSPIVLVVEADHHCDHHDDCQICEVIRTAQNTIKTTIKIKASTEVKVASVAFIFVAAILAIAVSNKKYSTPVDLKTKLSN